MSWVVHTGDNLDALRQMPDCSVDAVVTDPPYGLGTPPDAMTMLRAWLDDGAMPVKGRGFMGKEWDAFVPQPATWREVYRVLKPGGHLLAFAGTRTQDLMALSLRIAGFEIRDMLGWLYGSGFPKSMDVSKAIDKAAGAEREVVGPSRWNVRADLKYGGNAVEHNHGRYGAVTHPPLTAPATEAARQWNGWGTALKPGWESVTLATKPLPEQAERSIIQLSLCQLEARLWLLLHANAAASSSTSSQSEFAEAFDTAQWTAADAISTRGALLGQMGMSLFELATTTSLSIVSSWSRTLAESWNDGSTSTTETKSSTTTDLQTLRFSLSQITPESIIKACSLPGGFNANASTAERHFNASLSLLQSILTLSATERVMSQARRKRRDVDATPSLEPITLARKPLDGTVAANVLRWGTGAINVDGCRVGANDGYATNAVVQGANTARTSYGFEQSRTFAPSASGRWPANILHDGSDEVEAVFPDDASRFFYSAKTAAWEREIGLQDAPKRTAAELVDREADSAEMANPRAGAGRTFAGRANSHPTVKGVDVMRWLVRLVTPPGGTVLDPYTGSGTTGMACILEGFAFIGCELSAEYADIARARIAATEARQGVKVTDGKLAADDTPAAQMRLL